MIQEKHTSIPFGRGGGEAFNMQNNFWAIYHTKIGLNVCSKYQ